MACKEASLRPSPDSIHMPHELPKRKLSVSWPSRTRCWRGSMTRTHRLHPCPQHKAGELGSSHGPAEMCHGSGAAQRSPDEQEAFRALPDSSQETAPLRQPSATRAATPSPPPRHLPAEGLDGMRKKQADAGVTRTRESRQNSPAEVFPFTLAAAIQKKLDLQACR